MATASHHLHIIDFLRIHFQIQLFAVRPATTTVPLDQHPAARDCLHSIHEDLLLCGRSATTIRPRRGNFICGASHSLRSRELLLITHNPSESLLQLPYKLFCSLVPISFSTGNWNCRSGRRLGMSVLFIIPVAVPRVSNVVHRIHYSPPSTPSSSSL